MEPKAPTATVGQRDYFCGYPTPQTQNLMHECRYGLEFMQMSHSCQPTDLRCPVRSTSMSLQWMQCPFPRNQIQKSLRSLARSATNPPDATPGTHSTSESYGNFWARARSEITRSPDHHQRSRRSKWMSQFRVGAFRWCHWFTVFEKGKWKRK